MGELREVSMLTTTDNPWDPFEQYELWYAYDLQLGYNTPGFLARITVSSNDLSDEDQRLKINEAINEIVEENVLGVYKKVTKKIEV